MNAAENEAREWVNRLVEDGMTHGVLPETGAMFIAITDGKHVFEVDVEVETVETRADGAAVVSAEITMRRQLASDVAG